MTGLLAPPCMQDRYLLLVALPAGSQKADAVADALAAAVMHLPAQLAKSLAWDQGYEMAEHKRFTDQTGIQVYFCDPKLPWQRGSNENTNGLLRQYLSARSISRCSPKPTSTPSHSSSTTDLDRPSGSRHHHSTSRGCDDRLSLRR